MYLISLNLSAFAFRLHQRSKLNKKLKKLSYNIYIFKSNINKKTKDDSNKLNRTNLSPYIYIVVVVSKTDVCNLDLVRIVQPQFNLKEIAYLKCDFVTFR